MGRIFKYLIYLVILGCLGVVGFAVFSELPAPTEQVVVPVTPQTE